MKPKHIINLLIFAVGVSFFTACEYDFIEPKKSTPIVPPGDTVSFSINIVPIWNNSSKCTSCHKGGGQSPDLSPSAAYSSITSMGLVDTATPANSIIYKYPNPSSSGHSWKKYTIDEAAAVLLWIQDGAKNN
jgi:hypothetical protein